jgi:hypothetical protein
VGDRVYEAGQAPQGAAFPFLTFQYLAGSDRNAIGAGARIFSRPLYQVLAWCDGDSYAAADAIADAADKALQTARGTVTVGSETYLARVPGRELPLRNTEGVSGAGIHYNFSGGRYRLFVEGV